LDQTPSQRAVRLFEESDQHDHYQGSVSLQVPQDERAKQKTNKEKEEQTKSRRKAHLHIKHFTTPFTPAKKYKVLRKASKKTPPTVIISASL
jgi:hypothetical protein